MTVTSYPTYTRAERIADAAVHSIGILGALIGTTLLFGALYDGMNWGRFSATLIYIAALLLMLTASMSYHLGAYTTARPVLRRLDHAAIYLKIAGTFTPLAVILGSVFGFLVLAAVWGIALFGAGNKLLARPGRITGNWVPYLILGWIGVALFVPLATILPTSALALMAGGGLLYTAGILFFRWENLKYANAIWHGFVVAASTCFFIGIALSLASVHQGILYP